MDRKIMIDAGAHVLRAGDSGDEVPSCVHQNCVARSHLYEPIIGDAIRNCNLQQLYQQEYSIEYAKWFPENLQLWQTNEYLLQFVLKQELAVADLTSCGLLFNSHLFASYNHEQVLQFMFEHLQIYGMSMCDDAALSMYAQGCLDGIVLDVGHGKSMCHPIADGTSLHFAFRMNSTDLTGGFASMQLWKQLVPLLHTKYKMDMGFLTSSLGFEMVQRIKEKCMRFDKPLDDSFAFTLPDGQVLSNCAVLDSFNQDMHTKWFSTSASFHDPHPILFDGSIAQMLHHCIAECPLERKKLLQSHIVLSGGCTMIPGFEAFIEQALPKSQLYLGTREYNNWIGGSILASLSTFALHLVTRKEYEEFGAQQLVKRFL